MPKSAPTDDSFYICGYADNGKAQGYRDEASSGTTYKALSDPAWRDDIGSGSMVTQSSYDEHLFSCEQCRQLSFGDESIFSESSDGYTCLPNATGNDIERRRH